MKLLHRLFGEHRPVMDAAEIERRQTATRTVLRSQIAIAKAEKVIRMLEAQASANIGRAYEVGLDIGAERRRREDDE